MLEYDNGIALIFEPFLMAAKTGRGISERILNQQVLASYHHQRNTKNNKISDFYTVRKIIYLVF